MSRTVYIYSNLTCDDFRESLKENGVLEKIENCYTYIKFYSIEKGSYHEEIMTEFNIRAQSFLRFKWSSGDMLPQRILDLLRDIPSLKDVAMLLDNESRV